MIKHRFFSDGRHKIKQPDATIIPELLNSLTPVIVIWVFFGLLLIFASDYLPGTTDPSKVARLGVLAVVMAGMARLLEHWRPQVGRWFAVMAAVTFVFLGIAWLETSAFLALVALATILIGLTGAVIVAMGESLLLLLLPRFIVMETDLGSTLIVLAVIWLMIAVNYPLYEIARWYLMHFKQAQDLLEEARDRKVELHQALDDLAHAYRELALLNERVAAMRLVAEEAQATKAAYVAKVSHEFRTPLNMIIGLTDVLMETPEIYGDQLSATLLEDLKIVHRNCQHLSSMVNDVLDLSQTEMGHLTLHREWVDLAEDIDNALTVVRPLLGKKHLTLQVNVPTNLPQVYCDRTRIRQVILNLVSNAARFTEQGGITIDAIQEEQNIVIRVSDTGPGITPEDAKRIFDPFFQGMDNLWRGREGSGLGLSISKQFVELHGGQIWLESEPGFGSTFSFKLPISPATPPSATPARVVCVENLASFYELIRYEGRGLAALCLWGNPSPTIRHLLRCLTQDVSPSIPLYVWADIDYGGLNILAQLRQQVSSRFVPYRMDLSTLNAHSRWAHPLSVADERNLTHLRTVFALADVASLIDEMLRQGLKLEQEAVVLNPTSEIEKLVV